MKGWDNAVRYLLLQNSKCDTCEYMDETLQQK